MMTTRGFTLVELLVAVTVAAILGVGLTQLLVSDSRFVGRQESAMDARQVARAALNLLSTDLRMVTDGGVVAAAAESVTVRIPVAFGVGCDRVGSVRNVLVLPADPARDTTRSRFELAVLSSNTYDFNYATVDTLTVTDSAACTGDGVNIISGSRLVELDKVGGGPNPNVDVGEVFYLYHELTYKFAASAMIPGRIGLWSRIDGEAAVEVAAPFDSTTQFAFLEGPTMTVTTTVPSPLSDMRGLELRLVGESERWASDESGPRAFPLTARILFVNRQ